MKKSSSTLSGVEQAINGFNGFNDQTPSGSATTVSRKLTITRRTVLAAGGGLFATGLHAQAAYPSRPIRVVESFPPGGPGDAIGRAMMDALSQRLGQAVILDSKTGAGGIIAASELARAPADGYTLYWALNDAFTAPVATLKTQPYALKDFAPLSMAGAAGFVLIVRADSPFRTVADIVKQAQATPDKLTYASWGLGGMAHLAMEALAKEAKIKLTHVPYKSLAFYLPDLLGGTIDMCFIQGPAVSNYEGKVRAIATLGPQRNSFVPSAPTFAESGYPQEIFKTRTWLGMVAPARTPPEIQARLVQEIKLATQAPAVLAALRANGYDVVNGGPEVAAAAMRKEMDLIPPLMREIGIQPQ